MSRVRWDLLSTAGGFLFVLLLVRVLFLVAALDPDEERVASVLDAGALSSSRVPERPLYDREELYAGAAAEGIRKGLRLPLSTYRFMPYGSGSLLVALAAVPLYALFGPRYLAFKILGLLITIAGGLCWVRIVQRWTGPAPSRSITPSRGITPSRWISASRWMGLLYLLAPPVLVRTALIAKGDHAEAMALIAVTCLLASEAVFAADDRARVRFAAGAGLAFGLGIFVTYSVVPVLAAVALAGCLRARLRPRRAWAAALAGFAVGIIPWLATVVATGGEALRVYGRPLGSTVGAGAAVQRLLLLGREGLMAGYDLPGGTSVHHAAAFVWLVAFAAGVVALARRIRSAPALLIIAGVAAQIAAFCLAAPDPSSRYLVPGYPFFLLAVLAPALVWPTGTRRESTPGRRALLGPAGVCVLGLASQAAVILSSDFGALREPLRGDDQALLGEVAGQKLTSLRIAALPEPFRSSFAVGFGKVAFYTRDPADWPAAARENGLDPSAVWRGIGIAWVESGRAAEAAAYLPGLAPEDRAALRAGLAEYSEVAWAPMLAYAGIRRAAGFLRGFDPADRSDLQLPLARTAAVLATQGVVPVPGGGDPVPDLFPPALAARGAGWSFLHGSSARARWWKPLAGSWTGRFAPPSPASPAELWQGAADAWGWRVGTWTPAGILGGKGGPSRLAASLERQTRGLDPPVAALFYEAAGEAAGSALRREDGPDQAASAAGWQWRGRIPDRYHEAFERGLQKGARP